MKHRARTGMLVAAVLAMVPPLYGGLVKAMPLASNGLALSEADRLSYQNEVWSEYEEFRIDGGILNEASSLPGAIYVFGDPSYYFLFDREQAVRFHGWTPQLLTEGAWEQLADDLVSARPAYIHVAEWAEELVVERGSSITSLLESHYVPVQSSDLGTWYELGR